MAFWDIAPLFFGGQVPYKGTPGSFFSSATWQKPWQPAYQPVPIYPRANAPVNLYHRPVLVLPEQLGGRSARNLSHWPSAVSGDLYAASAFSGERVQPPVSSLRQWFLDIREALRR